MRIVYCPLEMYESRYTLQLKEWNIREFKRLSVEHIVIDGTLLNSSKEIRTGLVLDAHQRSYYCLSQMMQLVKMHAEGQLTSNDFIYFEDLYHPGIDALAYCTGLAEYKKDKRYTPWVGVRCLAQTIDPDDFVHYTGLSHWMRRYEQMVNEFVDIVFINSEEMLSFMTAAGWNVPVQVTGLPFGKDEVRERANYSCEAEGEDFNAREGRVSFASRIADEKQPEFFLAVIKEYNKRHEPRKTKFEILSGGLISSPAVDKAVIQGLVEVYPNLTKEAYYGHLLKSRVLFNCSLQDWGSVTIPEADALGCNVLAPAYHSFPELFQNDKDRLYIPWSIDDAVTKLRELVRYPSKKIGQISDRQDKTIERTIDYIEELMANDTPTYDNPADISYRKRITRTVLDRYYGSKSCE